MTYFGECYHQWVQTKTNGVRCRKCNKRGSGDK